MYATSTVRSLSLSASDRVRLNRMYVANGNAIRNLLTADDRTSAFRGFGLLHNCASRRIRGPAVTLIPLSPRH